VAIGEYGTDVLAKLADCSLNNNACYKRYNTDQDNQVDSLQLKNGE